MCVPKGKKSAPGGAGGTGVGADWASADGTLRAAAATAVKARRVKGVRFTKSAMRMVASISLGEH
jgi:hypothetical protein